jgi:transposase-like protein
MTNYKNLTTEEKRQYWKTHIQAWQESGQSQIEYCRNHNIKKSTLGYWRTRLTRENGFVEVPVEIASTTPIEIIISDKVTVRIRKGFDPDVLIQTVKTLEQLS